MKKFKHMINNTYGIICHKNHFNMGCNIFSLISFLFSSLTIIEVNPSMNSDMRSIFHEKYLSPV